MWGIPLNVPQFDDFEEMFLGIQNPRIPVFCTSGYCPLWILCIFSLIIWPCCTFGGSTQVYIVEAFLAQSDGTMLLCKIYRVQGALAKVGVVLCVDSPTQPWVWLANNKSGNIFFSFNTWEILSHWQYVKYTDIYIFTFA